MSIPIWKENPYIFAHITWDPEVIFGEGVALPAREGSKPCSMEGLGFSVSLHPRQWAALLYREESEAPYEIPVVVLRFTKPALDYYAFTKKGRLEDIDDLTEWGVRNGWITRGVDIKYWSQYAQAEMLIPEEETDWERLVKGGKEPKRYPGWRSTAKMREHLKRHYRDISPTNCFIHEVLNLWLARKHPEIGMVWYQHPYYPQYGSVPQGAILPNHFGSIELLTVTTLRKWPSEQRKAIC
jgi:hypothetical protein